jgi:hypothetical protein
MAKLKQQKRNEQTNFNEMIIAFVLNFNINNVNNDYLGS